MSVRSTNLWFTIEGAEIKDLQREYGTLSGIPLEERHIYYGHPEIRLQNPTSTTHSTIYCIQSIKNQFGYSRINDINQNWSQFIQNINSWMANNTVNIDDPNTAYYVINKPFTVEESCVIFYDESTKGSITGSHYSYYSIVLVDEYATPQVIDIVAKYNGNDIPVGEEVNPDDVLVKAIYDDGNEIKINTGAFTIDNDGTDDLNDTIVNRLGANVFKVYYMTNDDSVISATFIVNGIKNLDFITGEWQGGQVAYKKRADSKFFKIVAHYTDETEKTVTDFTFPNGNMVTETNKGLIDIYYKGKTCQVEVPLFEVTDCRLIAYYNGPNVEVGHDYQKSYLTIKIIYSTNTSIRNSYSELVDINDCTLDSTTITKVGSNNFIVTYEGELGEVQTSFSVIGFIPDLKPTAMEATYNGPGVYVGKTIDIERILCNVRYNDGTIKQKKDFIINTNIISGVGVNEFNIYYTEGSTTVTDTISVMGLENDTTTENNIFPTSLPNFYPVATILNNRYRGPAEGIKTNDYARMIIKNLVRAYEIFASLEKQYNEIVKNTISEESVKIRTLNDITYMNHQIADILNDNHYSTGIYKAEDVMP